MGLPHPTHILAQQRPPPFHVGAPTSVCPHLSALGLPPLCCPVWLCGCSACQECPELASSRPSCHLWFPQTEIEQNGVVTFKIFLKHNQIPVRTICYYVQYFIL